MLKTKNKTTETVEQRIIREWKADASIRAEFGSLNRYSAFVKAKESGRAKIYGDKGD